MFLIQSVGSIVVLNPIDFVSMMKNSSSKYLCFCFLVFHRIKKVVHLKIWNDMNYCGWPVKIHFYTTYKKIDLSECVNAMLPRVCTFYICKRSKVNSFLTLPHPENPLHFTVYFLPVLPMSASHFVWEGHTYTLQLRHTHWC